MELTFRADPMIEMSWVALPGWSEADHLAEAPRRPDLPHPPLGGETPEGAGWLAYTSRTDDLLRTLFPTAE